MISVKCISIMMSLFFLLTTHAAFADVEPIGNIKNLTGIVKVFRDNQEFTPIAGTELFNEDTLRTGPSGRAGILLLDDTVFTLGPDSELKLEFFEFDPPNKTFSLAARMIKGTFVFISGLMGKMSPESIELSTPDGIVAIRGTKLAIQVKEKK